MKLSEILSQHQIKLNLDAEDKIEAIEELVDLLISEHEVSLSDRDTILDVVLKRESSISTGIGENVAIPHGTVECIDDIIGAIGISENGINFDSFDGLPVYIVLLLLVPKDKFGKHIKTLANIARILHNKEIRERICTAGSSGVVMKIITDTENEIPAD